MIAQKGSSVAPLEGWQTGQSSLVESSPAEEQNVGVPRPVTDHQDPRQEYSPRSDAPFRAVARLVVGATHAVILVGIVGMLFSYFVIAMKAAQDDVVARIVGEDIVEVPTPCAGQFRAVRRFAEGELIHVGELLGQIYAPDVDLQLAIARRNLAEIQRRELFGDSEFARHLVSDRSQVSDLDLERMKLEREIVSLDRVERAMQITSPITGRIHSGKGLSGSRAVQPNESVAVIWPLGGKLHVEIEGPVKIIHRLVRSELVRCHFSTPNGTVNLQVKPLRSSLRLAVDQSNDTRRRGKISGFVECIPVDMPESLQVPGLIGKL